MQTAELVTFEGRTFTLNTTTESKMTSEFDGKRGTLIIRLDDGKEVRTIRRSYQLNFIRNFTNGEFFDESNLTQILFGIYLVDPKGLYQLTLAPRTSVSTLFETYRDEFHMQGCMFHSKVIITAAQIRVESQDDPDRWIVVRRVADLTRSLLDRVIPESYDR